MFLKTSLSLALAVLLLGPAQLIAQPPEGCQNLLVEGGFENAGGWSTVPGPGLTTAGPERQSAVGPAPEGNLYLEVASNGPTWVRQTVDTTPSSCFVLGFAYRPRPSYDSKVDVYWNDDPIAELLRPGDPETGWRYFETRVIGTGTDRIDFRDVSLNQGRERAGGALIDDVYLCRVACLAPKACCCGSNLVKTRDDYPVLHWGIREHGDFVRMWWDQGGFSEAVAYPYHNEPVVSGSLQQDPYGHGVVALTAEGNIVRVAKSGNDWQVEQVMPRHTRRIGGIRPCTLISTTNGNFRGIWGVSQSHIVRFYRDSGSWKFNWRDIGDHATKIVPSSLYEIWDGRIGGLLKDGQRWGTWFEDNDPAKMRFDYAPTNDIAVPPPTCRSESR